MRTCVITPVCNQGPFLLEWVAWYKGLGFTEIIAVSNNCTDGSDILLDMLAEAGLITHIALGDLEPGSYALRQAFDAAKAHPLIAKMDWLMVCDMDEFLVINSGAVNFEGFIRRTDPNFIGMAIHWKCFGTSNQPTYEDGLVHQQFRGAATEKSQANVFFKSIFRNPHDFATFNSHSPNTYLKSWGQGDAHWVNSGYQRLQNFISEKGRSQKATAATTVTHNRAQLNHYITKSAEHMAAKKGIASASNHSDRYTDTFFEIHNRCDELDFQADRHFKGFSGFYDILREDGDLMQAHHGCCAFYVQWLCERTGRDPEKDPRFIKHRDLALSL